ARRGKKGKGSEGGGGEGGLRRGEISGRGGSFQKEGSRRSGPKLACSRKVAFRNKASRRADWFQKEQPRRSGAKCTGRLGTGQTALLTPAGQRPRCGWAIG